MIVMQVGVDDNIDIFGFHTGFCEAVDDGSGFQPGFFGKARRSHQFILVETGVHQDVFTAVLKQKSPDRQPDRGSIALLVGHNALIRIADAGQQRGDRIAHGCLLVRQRNGIKCKKAVANCQ